MMPTKQERGQVIAQCIAIACRHFKSDPTAVFSSECLRDQSAVMARAAVWTHMHKCGMSYDAIGKAFNGKTVALVRGRRGLGKRFVFANADREMISKMPQIWNSIINQNP